jgi:hypothetical protein
MAIFQGLAEGMTNAFMTPFLQRQQMDMQDQRKRQQGALLKQGLSQFFGANSPEELALRQMPDEIIKDLANPMVGRYNTRLGNEREDTVQKNTRGYTETQNAAGRSRKRQTQRSLFNTVSPGMGDRLFVDPTTGQEKDIELDPVTMSYYLRNFEDQQSVAKLNAWARSLYPDWKDAPTSQAVMDAVNSRQQTARDTTEFGRSKQLIQLRETVGGESPETLPALTQFIKQQFPDSPDAYPDIKTARTYYENRQSLERIEKQLGKEKQMFDYRTRETYLSPYGKNVLAKLRQLRTEIGQKALQEAIDDGDLASLFKGLTEEEGAALDQILAEENSGDVINNVIKRRKKTEKTNKNPSGMRYSDDF